MPRIVIRQACTEFGQTFTVGQSVTNLSKDQCWAMVVSNLATCDTYLPPPADGAPIPVTSVAPAVFNAYSQGRGDSGFTSDEITKIKASVSDFGEAGIGPLKITAPDGYDVGDTLTATPTAGWTVGGYQWTRDGVDIAGATSSTYTLTLADVQMPHLPAKVIGVRAVSPVYSYLSTLPTSASYPAGYLSIDNEVVSIDGAVLSIV